jgi:hypothetical protein
MSAFDHYDKLAIYRKCQKINMCLRLKKEMTSKIREGGEKCKIKLLYSVKAKEKAIRK